MNLSWLANLLLILKKSVADFTFSETKVTFTLGKAILWLHGLLFILLKIK